MDFLIKTLIPNLNKITSKGHIIIDNDKNAFSVTLFFKYKLIKLKK